MLPCITLADSLKNVFVQLNDVIVINGGETVFACWTKILGGGGRSEYDVLTSMTDIHAAISKLEKQIASSKTLDEFLKSNALQTVRSFRPLFSFENLTKGAGAFKGVVNPTNVGHLGMLSFGLMAEFSEPQIEKVDADEVKKALEEVKGLLNSSDVPVDLKVSLEKHVDAMLWWIAHPELLSMQDIFESAGASLVVAKQMQDRANLPSDNKPNEDQTRNVIMEKIGRVFSILGNTLKFFVQNPDKMIQLEQVYRGLNGPTS